MKAALEIKELVVVRSFFELSETSQDHRGQFTLNQNLFLAAMKIYENL